MAARADAHQVRWIPSGAAFLDRLSTEQAAIISGGRFALEDRETAVRQLRADVDLLAQLDHVEALLGGYGHRELVALAEMDALYASESDAAVTQETPDAL